MRPNRAPMALARATISGMAERGTTMSSESLSGWTFLRLTERYFRSSQISRRCASPWATTTSPWASAPQSLGHPHHLGEDLLLVVAVGLDEQHGAGARGSGPVRCGRWPRSETSSTSSRQRGMTPWASTRETARAASSTERKTTSAVDTWRGRGRSFSVTSVTTARVPSLPTSSAVRS